MLVRKASRLISSVGIPSKYTLPSVRMQRRSASVSELCTSVVSGPSEN